MSGQPPDAVGHLRGLPESRPLPGLNSAVSCSSRVRCLNIISTLQALLAHLLERAVQGSVALTPFELSMV